MKLRPHHLLCMQNFVGHGYSEEFSNHMTSTLDYLKEHPDTHAELVSSCDEICCQCPHNEQGTCTSDQKVEKMDRMVLEVLGEAKTQGWEALQNTVHERILKTDRFSNICADCCWYSLCSRILRGENNENE